MERDMKELLVEYSLGNLSGELEQYVRSRIEKEPGIEREYKELSEVLEAYDHLPEELPPAELRSEFNDLLNNEIKRESKPIKVLRINLFLKVAASILLLCIAVWLGWYISGRQTGEQLRVLEQEMAFTKETILNMMVTSSASTRMKGVNSTSEIRMYDDEVMNALFFTLNFDDNTNVRLAALNAIAKFSDEGKVREELIRSLKFQDNPTIQIALIELLVEIREKSAIEPLRDLLQQEGTEDFVKEEAQLGIFKLS